MHKIWLGLGFAGLIANPVLAQDYSKNFAECAKELGLNPDAGYSQKIQSEGGRVLHKWWLQSDAQLAAFNDCVARKASLAPKPTATGRQRVSR